MKMQSLTAAALAAALTVAPLAALAQDTTAEPSTAEQAAPAQDANPVVARIDGQPVYRSEVLELALSLPAQYQAQIQQIFPLLVQRLIDFKLATRAGQAAGLADDSEVKARVAAAEERAIRDVYLERHIAKEVTEEALRKHYEEYLKDNPPKEEQRARHILLKTEDEAKDVIAKLDGGADFADLAKELSTGPSGAQGGDLGYFTADQMVPEFSAAVSKLKVGEYTHTPTKTQFGWHVIKLEDRRQKPQPTFEEMAPQMRQDMAREVATKLFQDLRDKSEIEVTAAGGALNPAAAPETSPDQAPEQAN